VNPLLLPRPALALWLAVLAAGSAAVAVSPAPTSGILLVWIPVCLVGELFWVPTLGRRGSISTAMLVHLVALAVLPAGRAVVPAVLVALGADLVAQRKPVVKAVYNAGLLAVTLTAAGLALRVGPGLAGGVPGLSWPCAMVLCGVAYWAVNRAGVVAIIALAEGVPPGQAWRENFGLSYEALVLTVEVVLAGMLAALWPRVGPAWLVGLAALCLFLNDAYRRRNRLEEMRAAAAAQARTPGSMAA
jgi:hypothetical protein